jgi:hypothetical protein
MYFTEDVGMFYLLPLFRFFQTKQTMLEECRQVFARGKYLSLNVSAGICFRYLVQMHSGKGNKRQADKKKKKIYK